jgi:hypothetical protein
MYVGHLKRDRFVFKHLISGSPGRKRRSVKKKRDVDDFWKVNVRQVIYRKYAKGRILII